MSPRTQPALVLAPNFDHSTRRQEEILKEDTKGHHEGRRFWRRARNKILGSLIISVHCMGTGDGSDGTASSSPKP